MFRRRPLLDIRPGLDAVLSQHQERDVGLGATRETPDGPGVSKPVAETVWRLPVTALQKTRAHRRGEDGDRDELCLSWSSD